MLLVSHVNPDVVTPHSEYFKSKVGNLSCVQSPSMVTSYILEQNQPDNNYVNVPTFTDCIAENLSKSLETWDVEKHDHFACDNPSSFTSKLTSPQSIL